MNAEHLTRRNAEGRRWAANEYYRMHPDYRCNSNLEPHRGPQSREDRQDSQKMNYTGQPRKFKFYSGFIFQHRTSYKQGRSYHALYYLVAKFVVCRMVASVHDEHNSWPAFTFGMCKLLNVFKKMGALHRSPFGQTIFVSSTY